MSRKRNAEELVGVRELRQNLSIYLDRVKTGTVFRVTERGRTVALLLPLPEPATAVERLIAAGRAAAPKQDLLTLARPKGEPTTTTSAALMADRADRL